MNIPFPLVEKIKWVYTPNVASVPNSLVDTKLSEIDNALFTHESQLTSLASFTQVYARSICGGYHSDSASHCIFIEYFIYSLFGLTNHFILDRVISHIYFINTHLLGEYWWDISLISDIKRLRVPRQYTGSERLSLSQHTSDRTFDNLCIQ